MHILNKCTDFIGGPKKHQLKKQEIDRQSFFHFASRNNRGAIGILFLLLLFFFFLSANFC